MGILFCFPLICVPRLMKGMFFQVVMLEIASLILCKKHPIVLGHQYVTGKVMLF